MDPDTNWLLIKIGALLLLALAVWWVVLVPSLEEYRDVRRRQQVWKELDEARASTTHRDPARPGVSIHRPHVRPAHGRREAVPALQPMSEAHHGLVVDDQRADGHLSNLVAFRRELAAKGKALDDLRIE